MFGSNLGVSWTLLLLAVVLLSLFRVVDVAPSDNSAVDILKINQVLRKVAGGKLNDAENAQFENEALASRRRQYNYYGAPSHPFGSKKRNFMRRDPPSGRSTYTDKLQLVQRPAEDVSDENEDFTDEFEDTDNAIMTPQDRRKTGRIVGGHATDITKFPFMAAIYVGVYHNCGGSLIAASWVLTAAHCLYPYNTRELSVIVGQTDSNQPELADGAQQSEVKYKVIHSAYNKNTADNDIALIKTKKTFKLGRTVQIIRYGTPSRNRNMDATQLSDTCIVVGWGDVAEQKRKKKRSPVGGGGRGAGRGGGAPPMAANPLRYVVLPLISLRQCQQIKPEFAVTDRQICTMFPAGGKDACLGDSGGPLIWPDLMGEYSVEGIVSYGEGCARPNMPAVYTRVDAFSYWIDDFLASRSRFWRPHVPHRKSGQERSTLLPLELLTSSVFVALSGGKMLQWIY